MKTNTLALKGMNSNNSAKYRHPRVRRSLNH